MLYLFLCLVIAGLVAFITFKRSVDVTKPSPQSLIKVVASFVVTLILLLIQPYTIHRVDAGNVGIKFHMTGDERGVSRYEYASGYVVYNTWFTRLYEFPTYQQHVAYEEQTIITKGGLPCEITPSFNYALKSGDVGDMFVNLRLDIEKIQEQWLKNAVAGTINDVANRWAVDSIFNHRQEFEANCVSEINKKVTRWFALSQLRTNIKPPGSLEQAIIAKTRALQDVQIAENNKQVRIAQGQANVAEAKADSAVQVTKAAGEARAIKERQLSLTPLYIEYLKVQRWKGEVPQVQSGAGAGLLMNLNNK